MQSQQTTQTPASKTMVIFSHPHISQSHINAHLFRSIRSLPGVTVRHLDSLYPDGKIDVTAEQLALEQADNVVFQFPLFWYTVPALLKAYFDEVMLAGWAYNRSHTDGALWGKTFRIITSTGATAEAYSDSGAIGKSFDQVLVPLKMISEYLGMHWREHLLVPDSFNITDGEIEKASEEYKRLLQV